ncbi:hypothetical protein D3C84_889770 [compost metagenome]
MIVHIKGRLAFLLLKRKLNKPAQIVISVEQLPEPLKAEQRQITQLVHTIREQQRCRFRIAVRLMFTFMLNTERFRHGAKLVRWQCRI